MKKQITYLKTGLLALCLVFGASFIAQAQISDTDQSALRPPLSGTDASTIFVYGGNGFKLTATPTSTSDGGEAGVSFTSFEWFIKSAAGGADGITSNSALTSGALPVVSGTVSNELSVSSLAPGFYTFMAQGHTAGDICLSEPEEFTVFVLAPLTVALGLTGDEEFCIDDFKTGNILTATVSYDAAVGFNTQTPNAADAPAVGAFELNYSWYKVASNISFDISTATVIGTSTTNTYTFAAAQDDAVGEWNYYVAVNYTVKASGPYVATAPVAIKVTPKPGKPTISIEEIL